MQLGEIYNPSEGSTLLIPSGPKHHLFIVLTKPCRLGRVSMVNITSVIPGTTYDQTCVLQPGEHNFIRRLSYVYYRKARVESVATLRIGVRDNNFIPKRFYS